MFNFLEDIPKSYTWPVEFKVPTNGGKYKKISFQAEFARLNKQESIEMKEAASVKDEEGRLVSITYKDVIESVLIDILAKSDEGKYAPLPEDMKDELLEIVGCEEAIFNAYFASQGREKTKN